MARLVLAQALAVGQLGGVRRSRHLRSTPLRTVPWALIDPRPLQLADDLAEDIADENEAAAQRDAVGYI